MTIRLWTRCFLLGASTRIFRRLVRVPSLLVVTALATQGALSVVPLRGHVLTYLAGGPAIASLMTVLLVFWRTWSEVSSWHLVERRLQHRRVPEPVAP